jgi:hypothetical protein
LWQELGVVHNQIAQAPWFLTGDFNAVKSLSEKGDGIKLNCYEEEFGEFLYSVEVFDFPYSSCYFT